MTKPKKAKFKMQMKPHVIGKIGHEHLEEIKKHPKVEPLEPPSEVKEAEPPVEEEHVVIAIPKSAWQKFKDAMGW